MAPAPPKFQTFEELLGLELQPLPVERHTGFLYELLGGSPMPIYNDAQAHPEKYRPEDLTLLDAVIGRGPARRGSLTCGCPSEHWDLSPDERKRLDQMTLTFATAERIEPPVVLRRRPVLQSMKKQADPIEGLPSFWWMKSQ